MPVQSESGKATRSALILAFVAIAGLAATAAYVKMTPRTPVVVSVPEPRESMPSRADVGRAKPHERHDEQGELRSPVIQGDQVVLGSVTSSPGDGVEPVVYLANESLKAVHVDSVKALSVQVKDRVALIEFSPEIEDGMGSSQEANFIHALQVSLGQLPNIDRFQITVGGQPVDSLGHFEVGDSNEVIRPATKA